MATFAETLEELIVGLSGRTTGEEEKWPEKRARELKAQYMKHREAAERLREEGGRALTGAAAAVAKVIDQTVREIIPLAKHPHTLASPIAGEINSSVEKLRNDLRAVIAYAPQTLVSRDPAGAIAAAIGLFDTLDRLIIRQLSLLYRDEVPDYFHGADAAAPFPCFRYSASNRGRVSGPFAPAGGESRFSATKIGPMVWPAAVVGRNGDLYTGHAGGEFVALRTDGSVKWRIRDDGMVFVDATGALGGDGFLYMASCDRDPNGNLNQGRVWKIEPETGEAVWTFRGLHPEDPAKDPHAHLASMFEAPLALGDEGGGIFVYAGSNDGRLYKIGPDGALVWEYDTESYPSGMIKTKPLISPDGSAIFIGTLSGQVHAVSAATGGRLWMMRAGGAVVSSIALGKYGELFFGCFDGHIYAAAPEDGEVFWTYPTLGLIHSSPAVAEDGSVVAGSTDGGVYCLDRFGKHRWTYFTGAPVKSSPAIDPGGLIYIGNEGGKLYCLSPDGRRVWSLLAAPPPQNELNSSPSFGPDGTIYIGSSSGDVFAVSPDYYRRGDDERVSIDPGRDSLRPEIPAGGEILVPLDRYGVPRIEPPFEFGIADNICLAVIAADAGGEIVQAEIDPRTLKVGIEPALGREVRIDARGRFVNIIPKTLMDYDTEYSLRVSGRYVAANEAREIDRALTIRTRERKRRGGMPLKITEKTTPGIVLKDFALCLPKELKTVSQAAIAAQSYVIAPVYIDRDRGVLAVAGCGAAWESGEYEFTPKSVNKMVATGVFRDAWFSVSGEFRVIAHGANVLFDKCRISGRFTAGPGIECGAIFGSASIHNMPDFIELLRVMRLPDSNDEISGFLSFAAQPFESAALRRPAGAGAEMKFDFDRVAARVSAPGFKADEHWIQLILIDTETGRLHTENRVEVIADRNGDVTEVCSTVPAARKGGTAAILVFDLFPMATIKF